VHAKKLISSFPYESFIIYAASGTWLLERHPSDALEADFIRLNRVFERISAYRRRDVPTYIENDQSRLLTISNGEKWSLRPLVISAHQPESEANINMVRMAAVSLADIHVHSVQEASFIKPQPYTSFHLIDSVLQRFDELALTIYADGPRWSRIAESDKPNPLALFRSLVHAEEEEIELERLATVVTKLPDSGFLKRFRMRKAKDARERWSKEVPPQLRWIQLRNRLARTIEAIEEEEKRLGYPRTLLHGDYCLSNVLFDRDRITEIVGWRSLNGGCPIYDLGYAALMFSANCKGSCRPALHGVAPGFDRDKLDQFVMTYRSAVLPMLTAEGRNSGFAKAVKSPTLLLNYMRLACYRVLTVMLDEERAMVLDPKVRCHGVLHALQVERQLWQ
jgi:hypothetical protein